MDAKNNLPATLPELDRPLEALAKLPATPLPQSDDLIKQIAMDIGKQVVAHIEQAYPAMFEAVSENAKLSVRNATYNAIMAAGEAFSQGLSERRLAENDKHRRTMRKLRKINDEAGTKPADETLRELQETMRG